MGSNAFYHRYFTLAQKRYMFCLMCNINIEQFKAIFNKTYKFVYDNVKTKGDAYEFRKKNNLEGFQFSHGLTNSITEKELNWLTEMFFSSAQFEKHTDYEAGGNIVYALIMDRFSRNYRAFVYNENPPLKEIASISWTEIIQFYWKWWSLSKQERQVFKF